MLPRKSILCPLSAGVGDYRSCEAVGNQAHYSPLPAENRSITAIVIQGNLFHDRSGSISEVAAYLWAYGW